MLQPNPICFIAAWLLLQLSAAAQPLSQKLAVAFQRFEKDTQLQNGFASLCVVDESGKWVFEKNSTVGLAPASTQKIITAATAYALLGNDFVYKTSFGLLLNSNGSNTLVIRGSGDPTLGSWRWRSTRDTAVLHRVLRAAGNKTWDSTVLIDTTGWNDERIPGGWIWEDIGNYYGTGASVINWHENQYDLYLRSGAVVGDAVVIAGSNPELFDYKIVSNVMAAPKGSGDNAYIYFSTSGDAAVVRGTIPVGEKAFAISGALPKPEAQFSTALLKRFGFTAIKRNALTVLYSGAINSEIFHTETSPPLDSIVYWFNKRSINLYGEALLKTIAYAKTGHGSTEAGVGILKTFWKTHGIAETALNIVDGSGLSPLNRVTTAAQVAVLQFARQQPWFASFYNSLPEYNGMKLKSGTIRGVKAFAGYHTAASGKKYSIAFLVNNYNGPETELVKKMFTVLDVLK